MKLLSLQSKQGSMQLTTQKEVHLYAMYLNFGLSRDTSYQSVIAIRRARSLMRANSTQKGPWG